MLGQQKRLVVLLYINEQSGQEIKKIISLTRIQYLESNLTNQVTGDFSMKDTSTTDRREREINRNIHTHELENLILCTFQYTYKQSTRYCLHEVLSVARIIDYRIGLPGMRGTGLEWMTDRHGLLAVENVSNYGGG